MKNVACARQVVMENQDGSESRIAKQDMTTMIEYRGRLITVNADVRALNAYAGDYARSEL